MAPANARPAGPALAREVQRRRTFAIISHPDAGKTTLTEKLLLYAGAIDLAGAVRRKSQQRHASSDWLEMEQARGISITSSVLQFEHRGLCFNLLDTPGHQDFSEDTYRVLTAVDSAVMVLDAAKGVEPQTVKLFEVCRQRGLPIITFVNKLDLPGRDPLELLDEIERVLGMPAVPLDWPIGMGPNFHGVYDLERSEVLRFERVARGERANPMTVSGIDDPALVRLLGADLVRELGDQVELLARAGQAFDFTAFRAGRQTPVFFGSALNNFGVGPFLARLGELAPPPQPKPGLAGTVDPADPAFSGFVFKVQANMDPQHRDSMAFLRIVSGRFEAGMAVDHPRLGRSLRLPRAHRIFARDRETTAEAFAGDVVGLVNPGLFLLGDTVTQGTDVRFPPIPQFPPEHFARLRPVSVEKHKAFDKGVRQLAEEGAIQLFQQLGAGRREPILGAVGELQFEVVQARLESEYRVRSELDRLPHRHARWLGLPPEQQGTVSWPLRGTLVCTDLEGRLVALLEEDWVVERLEERNPGLRLNRTPGAEGA
jgi:peptide chain release factor 3